MSTTVRSFCKINLGLAVGPLRQDGFHGLTTGYQTLALHEFVTVSASRSAHTTIVLEANHPGVPSTATGEAERNTAWRMVKGALERLRLSARVEVRIDKRLPVQGGLGAGSANAAAALLGLERELGVVLDSGARLELAAAVGSDVPLFLLGGTVLGLGRGEEIYPLPDLAEHPCVLALPALGVSTARAFQALDERLAQRDLTPEGNAGLTGQRQPDRLKQLSSALTSAWMGSAVEAGREQFAASQSADQALKLSPTGIACTTDDLAENPLLALVRTGMENDFEEVVLSEHPSLRSTKRDLMGNGPGDGGALYAALSGSGSALFGLYESQANAEAAQQRVRASGTRAIVTSTIARPKYWRTMFAGTAVGVEGRFAE